MTVATPAYAAVTPALSAAGAAGGTSNFSLFPAATHYFSHTAAYRGVAVPPAATAAAATPSVLLFPIPEAAAAAANSSRAAAAATAEQALSASLQAATAAVGHPVTQQQQQQLGIGSSRAAMALQQAAAVQRPGFLATAGTILREEGPTAFTRGIQVWSVAHSVFVHGGCNVCRQGWGHRGSGLTECKHCRPSSFVGEGPTALTQSIQARLGG